MHTNHHRLHQDAGITVQDALFNGVIALLVFASIVAIFFLTNNQIQAITATEEFSALVSGIRSAGAGVNEKTTLDMNTISAMSALPTDVTIDASGYYFDAPWAAEIYYGPDNYDFFIEPITNYATCRAILQQTVRDSQYVSKGSSGPGTGDIAVNGVFDPGITVDSACLSNGGDIIYDLQFD